MKLSTLLKPFCDYVSSDPKVLSLQNDSRKVTPGALFIAYPGAVSDGRDFIEQAVRQGAIAIVYEPKHLKLPTQIPCIAIPNLSQHLAFIAARFFGMPSQALQVSGVTGTNGKTTIAYQLTQAHQSLGRRAAYMGTIGQGEIGQLQPLMNTTPDALCVQQLLSGYQHHGIQQVCMEVSSHALSEHRVDEVAFREAIYTNLSHEHLDYHHTMPDYAQAKARLFATPTLDWVILNKDDAYTGYMLDAVPKSTRVLTYGQAPNADVRASNCRLGISGSECTVASPWGEQCIHIPSLGLFNLYNSLAVYTSLLAHGYPIQAVGATLTHLVASPGRMEIVAKEPYVIVDYAHTPDALDNVLKTLSCLKSTQNSHIWLVFGCGGDRDKTKRPLMGKLASMHADKVILTSDNPRHEDPALIIQDITAGMQQGTATTMTIIDRREAIAYALQFANKHDIVLIAGKGHEDYQIIGDQRFHFSDQAEVRKLL